MRRLHSVDEVLQVLYPAWERYGVSPQAVSNWRSRERIPLKYYLDMMADLSARQCLADASLWGVGSRHYNSHDRSR